MRAFSVLRRLLPEGNVYTLSVETPSGRTPITTFTLTEDAQEGSYIHPDEEINLHIYYLVDQADVVVFLLQNNVALLQIVVTTDEDSYVVVPEVRDLSVVTMNSFQRDYEAMMRFIASLANGVVPDIDSYGLATSGLVSLMESALQYDMPLIDSSVLLQENQNLRSQLTSCIQSKPPTNNGVPDGGSAHGPQLGTALGVIGGLVIGRITA